jgi:hypothetical protein
MLYILGTNADIRLFLGRNVSFKSKATEKKEDLP